MYNENFCDSYNEKVKFFDNLQLQYKHNAVYKDCSYDIPEIEKKIQLTRLRCLNRILTASLSKHDHHTPAGKPLEVKKTPVEEFIADYNYDIPVKSDVGQDPARDVNLSELSLRVDETTASLTEAFVKANKPTSSKRKLWRCVLRPRFVCPCCIGGEDSDLPLPPCEPQSTAAAAHSLETIDLAPSNTALSHLDLRASLMSMLHMQRRPKKTPLFYAKIAKFVLRNSYKSTVGIMEPLNFKPRC